MIEKELFAHKQEEFLFEVMKDNLYLEEEIVDYYINFEEKFRKPDLLGKTVRVSENQFKDVYNIIKKISNILNLEIPQTYVYEDFYYGIDSKGISEAWIEISAKTIEDFSKEELAFLIGRELCNIKFKHTYYSIVISEGIKKLEGSGLPGTETTAKVLKASTYKWCRAANYTADNFGYIICGNLKASINAILKLILNNKYLASNVNIKDYIKQAETINKLDDDVYNYAKMDELIPYGPFRIKNLIAYSSSKRAVNVDLEGIE